MKLPSPAAALAGEQDNFMRSIAALHSVIVSLSSSIIFSLVRRFLELEEMKNIFYMNIHVLIDHKQNFVLKFCTFESMCNFFSYMIIYD